MPDALQILVDSRKFLLDPLKDKNANNHAREHPYYDKSNARINNEKPGKEPHKDEKLKPVSHEI